MDLQQQVQDLAEAWVAANTNTTYNRTQIPEDLDDPGPENAELEDASDPMKTDPLPSPDCGMPSTSTPQAHHNPLHYEQSVPLEDPGTEDLPQTASVKSQLAAALAARGSTDVALTSSRKRKQSSPQPCREVVEAAAAGDQPGTEGDSGPGPSKVVKAATPSQLETKSGKMLPVHCVVEPLDLPGRKGDQPRIPTEGYAIVPSTLLLKELVRVALSKLEFPMEHVHNATGVLQIRNWKPLPFSAITDDPQVTVGQILGDLLSHITLKIKILPSRATSESSPSPANRNNNSSTVTGSQGLQLLGFSLKKSGFSGLEVNGPTAIKGLSNAAQEIRLKLLQLLEKRGPTYLVSHGCPFSQGAVAQLMQGKYLRPIYMEKLQAFYQWYNIYNGLMDNTLVSAEKLDNMVPSKPSSRHWRRPRTLFDPRHELPRLLAWYRDNPRPSRAEMEMYLAELNSMERRRNGHPLQYTSIAIWFKNARAKYRGLGRVSPEPYDRMSPQGMGYICDENVNVYESEPEPAVKEPVMESKPKKDALNCSSKIKFKAITSSTPVVLTSPKRVVPIAISGSSSPPSSSYAPTVKVKSAAAPVALSNMQLTTQRQTIKIENDRPASVAPLALSNMQLPAQRQSIKIENDRHASTAGGVSAQTTPEAASQVTDIRKIASGFGISLSPADTPDATPISQAHAENRTVQDSGHDIVQRNGMSDKHLVENDIKKQQQQPPPLQPKKLFFKNLELAANSFKATRKRFNIHPAIEVPKLQAWFSINPKPDRHSIEQYVAELNSSEFRRNQSKYDSRVVYVWFKNARAKYSRLNTKQISPERMDNESMDQTCELDLSMHSSGELDLSMHSSGSISS